ncbi:MAG: META domain-containing protein [Candidatus Limnocylindria bacterium]
MTSVLVLVVLLAACAADQGRTQPAASDAPVVGAWVLTGGSIDDVEAPVLDEHRITLTITGSQISGVAACNHYGGEISVGADGLRIEDLGQTDMGCEEPAMSAESAYVGALLRVRAIEREGEELVATGDGVELRFAALEPPPTAELIDTAWILETVFVGDVAAPPLGESATLELRADGTFSGSTGCRTFSGQWMEQGDQIQAPTLGMDQTECPADLSAQDSHVVSVIGDGFIPTIEGDLLKLMDPGGIGLVYRTGD